MTDTISVVSQKLANLVPLVQDAEKLLGEDHQLSVLVEFIKPTPSEPFGNARFVGNGDRAVSLLVVEDSSQICVVTGIRGEDTDSQRFFESGELGSVALSKIVADYIFDKAI